MVQKGQRVTSVRVKYQVTSLLLGEHTSRLRQTNQAQMENTFVSIA